MSPSGLGRLSCLGSESLSEWNLCNWRCSLVSLQYSSFKVSLLGTYKKEPWLSGAGLLECARIS